MAQEGIIPEYIEGVNTLVRFWENPCDAPWTLYFELALPAAGKALLELLLFDVDDVIRGYARPKGLRTGRHGRKGRKSGRRRGGIPELGELIGKNWPGYDDLSKREVTQGVKNLWLVDGVIQRALWYWLVADVTFNFFVNWLSAVQESERCRTMRVGAGSWEAQPTIAAIQGWQDFIVGNVYQHGTVSVLGGPFEFANGFAWSSGGASCVAAFNGRSIPNPDPDVRLESRIVYNGNVVASSQSEADPNDAEKHGVILAPHRMVGGGSAIVQLRVVPHGFFTVETGFATCVQTLQDL